MALNLLRAVRDEIGMRRALGEEFQALPRPERLAWGKVLRRLPLGRSQAKLYELQVLRALVAAAGELFPEWEPRMPPPDEDFLDDPHYRLMLPEGRGELIWQPIYSDAPTPPLRSITHTLRPDMSIERAWKVFVADAKYTFRRDAAVLNLRVIHFYQNSLVRSDGSEAVEAAIAVMANYSRLYRRFYTPEYFAETGTGLVYLPAGRRGERPDDGQTVTLKEALERFLNPPT